MEFTVCPLCESPSIRKKRGVYKFNIHGESLSTPVIQYWECPNCGEVFFDREANRKIDEALLQPRKQQLESRSQRKSSSRIRKKKPQPA
jgi:YgiT-type zinc finger domain-containing protein